VRVLDVDEIADGKRRERASPSVVVVLLAGLCFDDVASGEG